MKYIFNLIVYLIDFFYKKKIASFLKQLFKNKNIVIIDVGAHHGESIKFFTKKFNIDKIFSYEPSQENFEILKKKINTNKNDKISLNNFGLGENNQKLFLNQVNESSSSTFCTIDQNSNYFKKKNKFLKFFLRGDYIKNKFEVSIKTLSDEIKTKQIKDVDLLKIDTEGFEFNVIKGAKNSLNKIKYIIFEHHYDNMIKKNYKFHELHSYLIKNNFIKVFKIKMPLRKTFEYVYANNNIYDNSANKINTRLL